MHNLRGGVSSSNMLKGTISSNNTLRGVISIGNIPSMIDPAVIEQIIEEYLNNNPPEPGKDGADGYSPTVSVSEIDGGYRITITDANGSETVDVLHGADGEKGPAGPDGYSPSAKVETIDSGVRISITDKEGTTTADIPFGSGGPSIPVDFKTDETLTLKDGILSVNTTDQMEQDNTLPITSAGVFATVGNIEALLKTI